MDKRFDEVNQRIDNVESAIKELNETQVQILNTIELIEKDVESNKKHIERLEKRDHFA